jgi:F0F1-type ATP synthase assembly protein I
VKGSQNKKIKSVMNGTFANLVGDETNNRIRGVIAGAVIGLIVGGIFRSNPLYTALVGGILGFISNKK